MKTKWIKCSERLPDSGNTYFVTFISLKEKRIVSKDFYHFRDKKWLYHSNVIAWAEIKPYLEPYTGEI